MLKKQKYVTAVFCLFLSFFFAAMGILQYQMIRGKKPVSTDAGIEAMNNDTVLVGGMPIGIYMETDGVMVLNTEQIAILPGDPLCPFVISLILVRYTFPSAIDIRTLVSTS